MTIDTAEILLSRRLENSTLLEDRPRSSNSMIMTSHRRMNLVTTKHLPIMKGSQSKFYSRHNTHSMTTEEHTPQENKCNSNPAFRQDSSVTVASCMHLRDLLLQKMLLRRPQVRLMSSRMTMKETKKHLLQVVGLNQAKKKNSDRFSAHHQVQVTIENLQGIWIATVIIAMQAQLLEDALIKKILIKPVQVAKMIIARKICCNYQAIFHILAEIREQNKEKNLGLFPCRTAKKIMVMITLICLLYVCHKNVLVLRECLIFLRWTCRVLHTGIETIAVNMMNLVASAILESDQMKKISIHMKMEEWSPPIT